MSKIKSIGVLCSGGDSPGMNCAIRAVVRSAINAGLDVYGIQRGFSGLLEGNIKKLDVSSVGNIIQHGGTILQTSRCLEFHEADIRKEAAHILKRKKIDALVVIGGNGSFNGTYALHSEHGIPVAGIPGTIDNDISGTDYSIGFDTAVQTAIDAVDKIRDTASSHERTFIVEVMGRKSAAIALHVGVCTGAENVVLPSDTLNIEEIAKDVKRGISRGKNSSIIIVAEGEKEGLSHRIREELKNDHGIDSHVCILGHIQRGGNPSGIDRFIASGMGYIAVKDLIKGEKAIVTAYRHGEVVTVPFSECLEKKTDYLPQYINLVKTLSI
ncbi:6-phosphofructokinase [Halobacteriovorax marinus]|uniref:ATP-dependent 6-phosphofructokinase n=1 Tax=Halobacteriovorax marinus TaxID=97084 RepID=A0A1Y5F229_9BACT|nr:6-phosphofructokinase [Halobacteriovorax marinus]